MPRLLPCVLFLATVTGTVAEAAPASAQMMHAIFTNIGGRDAASPVTPLATSINLAECLANAPVTIYVTNIPTTAARIDFWLGQMCTDSGTRASITDTSCLACLGGLSTATGGQAQYTVTTDVHTLLGIGLTPRNQSGASPRACETIGLDGDSQVYIEVLATAGMACDTGTSLGAVAVDNGSNAGYFTVDTVPPSAPTSLVTGSGDTAIPVSWMLPTGGLLNGGTYNVYVDAAASGGGEAGTCTSSILSAGGTAPSTATLLHLPALATTIDASTFGLAFGSSGAVAVAAVDKALNVSLLSNVGCFTRVQSVSFWDRHCGDASTGGGCTGGSCSVSTPGAPAAGGTALLGLALIALGLTVRFRGKR